MADPAWATRATMWLWDGLGEWMMPLLLGEGEPEALVDELLAASRAAELACERILGAREGSLRLIDYEGLREWLLELVAALRAPSGRRHELSALTAERM